MKFRPPFIMVAFLLTLSLACTFAGSGTQQPQDEPTQQEKPTNEKKSTPTTASDTSETLDLLEEQYFTEAFDGSLDSYAYFNTGKGSNEKMSLETDNGYLVFNLTDTNLWIYITYNPFTYKDVAIEVTADDQSGKNNTVSLLCRYHPDQGWYEFSISNGGMYWIYAYDSTGAVSKGYNTITDGTSTAVRQGKDVNTYSASCEGDKLTLSINGVEVKSVKDAKYKFREGKVGFSVSSFDVTPILVNVDSFTISEP